MLNEQHIKEETVNAKKWAEAKLSAYNKLIELAELEDDDLVDSEECNADYALETIMRFGSCKDNVDALKYYSVYINLNNLLLSNL